MKVLIDIFTNHMILVPLIAWATCQVLKTITYVITEKKFVWKRVIGDGGMPSAHSATTMSLAVMCGWLYGFSSAAFAIAIVLTVVIARDSVGVRRDAGFNAAAIKALCDKANAELPENEQISTKKLKTLAGHTPLQVLMGTLAGIAVAVIYSLIAGLSYCAFA